MDKLQREIIDGDEAQRLIDSPIFKGALEKVRNGIVTAMQDSPMGDERTHNKLVIALQLLGQIKKNITTVAVTGKLARIQIEQTPVQKLKRVAGF